MKTSVLKILIITLTLASCIGETQEKSQNDSSFVKLTYEEQVTLIKQNLPEDSILSFDQEFVNNEILKGKYTVELEVYLDNDCYPMRRYKQDLVDNFEGFQNVGDIDNDGKDDYVFVLEPLTFCEEGQSYYFSNPNIERIYTESRCCHPYSIFSMGDIDEDGRNEIGQYYSGCASRFKHIKVWTIKENTWNLLGQFTFSLNHKYDVFEDFDKLYKKKSKGVFQFLEISDVDLDGELVKEWKTIIMK